MPSVVFLAVLTCAIPAHSQQAESSFAVEFGNWVFEVKTTDLYEGVEFPGAQVAANAAHSANLNPAILSKCSQDKSFELFGIRLSGGKRNPVAGMPTSAII